MNTINKEIGIRIAASRKNKGLSTTELSKLTGFSIARISHWEQGRRLPNLDSILVLEKFLDVPASYLLAMENLKNSNEINNYNIPFYKLSDFGNDKLSYSISISIPVELKNNDLFAIQLVDDSMGSLFRKNDIVVFNRFTDLHDGTFILILINKTKQILFRKFMLDNSDIDNPKYKFIPLNLEYHEISIRSKASFTILGVYNNQCRLFI